jgi:hypothetical protein
MESGKAAVVEARWERRVKPIQKPEVSPITLAEAGIDKNLESFWLRPRPQEGVGLARSRDLRAGQNWPLPAFHGLRATQDPRAAGGPYLGHTLRLFLESHFGLFGSFPIC